MEADLRLLPALLRHNSPAQDSFQAQHYQKFRCDGKGVAGGAYDEIYSVVVVLVEADSKSPISPTYWGKDVG
jgi:hypothetical protein